eukprot:7078396-Pyramimonas_sp.AAC.2
MSGNQKRKVVPIPSSPMAEGLDPFTDEPDEPASHNFREGRFTSGSGPRWGSSSWKRCKRGLSRALSISALTRKHVDTTIRKAPPTIEEAKVRLYRNLPPHFEL